MDEHQNPEEATESGKDNLIAAAEAYVRNNPTKAVLIALGVGLLLGLVLRK